MTGGVAAGISDECQGLSSDYPSRHLYNIEMMVTCDQGRRLVEMVDESDDGWEFAGPAFSSCGGGCLLGPADSELLKTNIRPCFNPWEAVLTVISPVRTRFVTAVILYTEHDENQLFLKFIAKRIHLPCLRHQLVLP